jgi:hypothetical protein
MTNKLPEGLTPEQEMFQEWVKNPVTQKVQEWAKRQREHLKEQWAQGTFSSTSKVSMLIQNASAIAYCNMLDEFLNLTSEELEDDGKQKWPTP